MNNLKNLALVSFVSLYTEVALAYDKVTLNKQGGAFSSFENFLQAVMDFFQGPYAVFIAFVGVLMVAIGVIFARDAGGIIALGMRVILGVGLIFVIGPILGYFM